MTPLRLLRRQAQLAERFDVHPNQITQWKSQLLERAAEVFASGNVPAQEGPSLKELHTKIGQQALEVDFFIRRARQTGRAGRKAMILFDHDPSRSAQVAARLLDGACGYVQSYGYAAYDAVAASLQLAHVGCFAHEETLLRGGAGATDIGSKEEHRCAWDRPAHRCAVCDRT